MQLYHFPFHAMGTACDLQLYADNSIDAQRVASIVIDDISRLESKYSRYLDNSLLARINSTAINGGSIKVDEETAGLLDYAQTCYLESEGLFDITSGLLRQAWNFKSGQLPRTSEINILLEKIGWNKLVWEKPMLSFPSPGMELDFGGVVKEYAADRAATLSKEAGINHGIINLGGDIRIIGPHPDSSPWKVGIKHPQEQESVLEMLELSEGALASSGDYERCITIDNVRYGHVLNPLTGWPVRTLAAVSVVADLCVVAGSASTIAMLREEAGKAWLKDLGLAHAWVDVDGKTGGNLN